ncbi:MAG: hypothetical protein IJF27_03210, partial [Oscillospiraceae bacterium]|nr:hypothetical protein [Oscillospiraceae bacterium]
DMNFTDCLKNHIDLLGCSSNALSQASGLSSSVISRYRSGERSPQPGSTQWEQLIDGIAKLAKKSDADITRKKIALSFARSVSYTPVEKDDFYNHLNTLVKLLDVNLAELSRSLNYDSSYVSRICSGKRTPANPTEFAGKVSEYVVSHYSADTLNNTLSSLLDYSPDQTTDKRELRSLITNWLLRTKRDKESIFNHLKDVDEFDLDEFINSGNLDSLKVPSMPVSIPFSNEYTGLQQIGSGMLAFFKATVLAGSKDPVTIYTNMPIETLASDPKYAKKWLTGISMLLKKGLRINMIHFVDRPLPEILLALKNLIPLHMTGLVESYYLKNSQDNYFMHFLWTSDAAVLTGEGIVGSLETSRLVLSTKKSKVSYYKKLSEQLFEKASPLMDVFRKDTQSLYRAFLNKNSLLPGERYAIRCSLPICTISEELLSSMMDRCNIPEEQRAQILQYRSYKIAQMSDILSHSTVTNIIPHLTKEEFEQAPMSLSIAGAFADVSIKYTYEEYLEHLYSSERFAEENSRFILRYNPDPVFRNIHISVFKEHWVMISKMQSPCVHFLIHHPKICSTIENLIDPSVYSD